MAEGKMVLCILGAMIGAGFASGRELMQFFSRWGDFSWLFIGGAAGMMTACMVRLMRRGGCGISGIFPVGKGAAAGQGFLFLLLICTGGGMASAAGEITALILPIHHARGIGFLATLGLAMILARYPLGVLAALGKILLPAILLAFMLILRIPGKEYALPEISAFGLLQGLFQALGYAGLNVMLSAGVLCETGGRCGERGLCRGAAWTGGAIGGLLLLGNAALLPHAAELADEPLPLVLLLRSYGKGGYYLSALCLYLAIFTTLVSVLRGMGGMLKGKSSYPYGWAGAMMGITGLLGFEEIVAVAYPALGIFSLAMIWWPQRKSAP